MRKYFPHLNTNVIDESSREVSEDIVLPLFKPLFPVKTSQGPIGVPVWCPNDTFAKLTFGEEFLDPANKKFFSRTSVFAKTVFKTTGCYILRLGLIRDEDTFTGGTPLTKAMSVITLTIDPTNALNVASWAISAKPISFFSEDEDESTDAIFERITAGQFDATTLNTAYWENFIDVGNTTVLNIPLIVVAARNEGEYGNNYYYSIGPDEATQDMAGLQAINSVLNTFTCYKRDTTTSTIYRISNRFGQPSFSFAMSDTVKDNVRNESLSLSYMVEQYWDADVPCPFELTPIQNNIEFAYAFVQLIYDNVTPAANTSVVPTYPYSVDLFNLTTISDLASATEPISIFAVGDTVNGILVSSSTVSTITADMSGQLEEGSDGFLNVSDLDGTGVTAITNALIETFSAAGGTMANPALMDAPRYPFNHIFDTGYEDAVKTLFCELQAIRDDLKVNLATWSGSNKGIADTVLDTISKYRSDARNNEESELYHTGACRVAIFGSSGKAIDRTIFRKQLPMTFEYCAMLAKLHNATYIKGHPEGEAAYFTVMDNPEWTVSSYDEKNKANLWDANVNYPQYFNNTTLHFAGIRSVYDDETSLFTNDSFVNMLVYVKQELYAVWAKYASVTGDAASVYKDALATLDKRLTHILAGTVKFKTFMYQTAREAALGFEHHLRVELYDDNGLRIINADIVAKRSSDY